MHLVRNDRLIDWQLNWKLSLFKRVSDSGVCFKERACVVQNSCNFVKVNPEVEKRKIVYSSESEFESKFWCCVPYWLIWGGCVLCEGSKCSKPPAPYSRAWVAQRHARTSRRNTSMKLQNLRRDLLGQFRHLHLGAWDSSSLFITNHACTLHIVLLVCGDSLHRNISYQRFVRSKASKIHRSHK